MRSSAEPRPVYRANELVSGHVVDVGLPGGWEVPVAGRRVDATPLVVFPMPVVRRNATSLLPAEVGLKLGAWLITHVGAGMTLPLVASDVEPAIAAARAWATLEQAGAHVTDLGEFAARYAEQRHNSCRLILPEDWKP